MSKLGLIGLTLCLGVGCFGGGIDLDFGPSEGLQDAWSGPGLESRYMVGSTFPVDIVSPSRPLDEYEVIIDNAAVFNLVPSSTGFDAEALAIGETTVELRAEGELIRRYNVRVTQPDAMELTMEREDVFGDGLNRLSIPVGDELAMMPGGELDVHVRYFEEGQRVYGGLVLETETLLATQTPEWSPQGNIVRILPDAAGSFPVTFRVGALEESVNVFVTDTVSTFELDAGTSDELVLLADASGELAGDQVIQPDARDADGRRIRGTLPVAWTVELDSETLELGEGTLLGVMTDGTSEVPVTATLGGLTATATARGLEMYLAR